MQELNILVSTDHNYVLQLRAMLRSLFVNNQDCDITVYLLHSGLPREDLDLLGREAKQFGGTFAEYVVNTAQHEASPITNVFPPEAFYRLFAADYLPRHIKRILYLDCDIIINGSLSELYNLPMHITDENRQSKRYLFAAAPDAVEAVPEDHRGYGLRLKIKNRLGFPDSKKYFNSGVLLMNLELLRASIDSKEIIELIPDVAPMLEYPDQDFLNLLYHKYILSLDHELYNFSHILYEHKEITDGNPVVIHFTGNIKPWMPEYPQQTKFLKQAKALYDKYASDDF